ncbi:MAG: phosphoenolpyruvate carboxykinase (ATP) [Bdellovibrionota bacterium]
MKLYNIELPEIFYNPAPALLYEHAVLFEKQTRITETGALVAFSGEKTGRSPTDKRIVKENTTQADIDWGDVNVALERESFLQNKQTALEYLNSRPRVYVMDCFAGWDVKNRIKVRVICSRPYHALFMHNMLITPTASELENFGTPDYTIINAGSTQASTTVKGIATTTSICLDFELKEMVILGTDYAGEMKKGVFTIMNYILPKKDILTMHCSVNEGDNKDVSIFCGLSGTGKTTLSADPNRKLIGDDEHYWTEEGLFNIEGGCYAKCDNLSQETEPEIYSAIRFGALLENVVLDEKTRKVDYSDLSITQNTRASYKIEAIANAKIPCRAPHAKNMIFLTADAYGVFPPISKLTIEQAMYFFVNGYTAKVAGTEMGIKEPKATFSACYGAPFMVWHPQIYATLLAKKLKSAGCSVWLVNTGWTGGKFGEGHRISLKHTRAILDSIHSGALEKTPLENIEAFGLSIPKNVENVPTEILNPRKTWKNPSQYDETYRQLKNLFDENNKKFAK